MRDFSAWRSSLSDAPELCRGLNEDHRVDQQARAVAAPLFVGKAAAELHRDVNGHGGIAIFSLFSPPLLVFKMWKGLFKCFPYAVLFLLYLAHDCLFMIKGEEREKKWGASCSQSLCGKAFDL